MKSKSNSDFALSQPNPPSAVPISVYKELAAELQATRAMIESLNTRNQQLVQQNQMIRQEVERVVQASFNLQQIVDFTTPPENGLNQTIADLSANSNRDGERPLQYLQSSAPQNHLLKESGVSQAARPLSNELFTEEPSRPQSIQKQSKNLGNMGILLTVLIVVLTAFGLGFVAVKQLLPSR